MGVKIKSALGSVTLDAENIASNTTVTVPAGGGTLVKADASGNVGIGTSNPNERLSVVSEDDTSPLDNGFAVYRAVGDDKVVINAQGGAAKFIADGGSTYIPTIFYRQQNSTLTESMRILPTGGITFNGDTAAANALDDYEEGTWTPGITTGSITASYGSYTKIGRFVKVFGRVTGFSDTSSSARVAVTGLPYAAKLGNDYESTGTAFARYVNKSAQAVYIPSNSSSLYFYDMSSGEWGNQELDHSNLEDSAADIYFSASYITT